MPMNSERPCDLISELYWLMRKVFERQLEDIGVSFMEFKALMHIQRVKSQSELIREMGVSKGTASKVLSSLEARGLVERKRVRRGYAVELTEKGKGVLEEIRKEGNRVEETMLSKMNEEEKLLFVTLLKKAINGMEGSK